MEAYIKGIIIIGAATSVLLMLLPHGSERSGRYLKYIGSLIALCLIIAPISGILDFAVTFPVVLEESTAGTSELYSEVISKTASNIANFIKNRCAEKFALDPDSVKVYLILDENDVENVKITEIQLFTNEQSSTKKERIRKHFTELFETEVFVFGP